MKTRDDKKKYVMKMIKTRPQAVVEALRKATPQECDEEVR